MNCNIALLQILAVAVAAVVSAEAKNLAEGGFNQDVLCEADEDNVFHVRWADFAPQLQGGFEFEECPDLGPNPVLKLDRGVQYAFWQTDISNWMHPLGFAYYPDGAHGQIDRGILGVGTGNEGSPELEYPIPEACDDEQFMCNPTPEGFEGEFKQAPLYSIDGEVQTWDDWSGPDGGYEELFYYPQSEWSSHEYGVYLTIPEDSLTQEFFYFCHIHQGMSGLIKVSGGPETTNKLVVPFVPANYYPNWGPFDQRCGSSQLGSYRPDKETGTNQKYCPGQKFMCEGDDSEFAKCMYALDCKMNYQMRSEFTTNPLVVFMHQMIPHHVNAVNMARVALKHLSEEAGISPEDPAVNNPANVLTLDLQIAETRNHQGHNGHNGHNGGRRRLMSDDDTEGVLDVTVLLRDIMDTQNHQIQQMKEWLERFGEPAEYCEPPNVVVAG